MTPAGRSKETRAARTLTSPYIRTAGRKYLDAATFAYCRTSKARLARKILSQGVWAVTGLFVLISAAPALGDLGPLEVSLATGYRYRPAQENSEKKYDPSSDTGILNSASPELYFAIPKNNPGSRPSSFTTADVTRGFSWHDQGLDRKNAKLTPASARASEGMAPFRGSIFNQVGNEGPTAVPSLEPAALPASAKKERSKTKLPKASEPETQARSGLNFPEIMGKPAWGRGKQRDQWTRVVLQTVRDNKSSLDKAKDVEEFCPGYRRAAKALQEMCWVNIISAITQRESDFVPSKVFIEPNGEASVGLLMMSTHQCPNARTNAALKNPIENLKCGTRLLARLIARSGYIAQGKSGGAANWSVLRKPYSIVYRGKRLKLGKRAQIVAHSKSGFQTVVAEARRLERTQLASAEAGPAVR